MTSHIIIKWLLWVLGFAILCSLLAPTWHGGVIQLQVAGRLLLGWYSHLSTIPANLTPTWQDMARGAMLIAATMGALHLMLKILHGLFPNTGRPWRWRWSAGVMVLALILFATTCASVGIVHHGVWVLKNPLSYDASRGIFTRAISNARQLTTAVQIYQGDHDGLAPDRLEDLVTTQIIEGPSLIRLGTIETLFQPPTVWIYLKPPDASQDPALPLLASPFPISRGVYVVALADGTCTTMNAAKREASLHRWREATSSLK